MCKKPRVLAQKSFRNWIWPLSRSPLFFCFFGGLLHVSSVSVIVFFSYDIGVLFCSDLPASKSIIMNFLFQQLKKTYLKPLTYYAAAFVVLHFFQFINRVQNTINEIPVYGLMVAHVISMFGYGECQVSSNLLLHMIRFDRVVCMTAKQYSITYLCSFLVIARMRLEILTVGQARAMC